MTLPVNWNTFGDSPDDEAEVAGMEAFEAGFGDDACPYREGTQRARDWLRGWNAAAALAEGAAA